MNASIFKERQNKCLDGLGPEPESIVNKVLKYDQREPEKWSSSHDNANASKVDKTLNLKKPCF